MVLVDQLVHKQKLMNQQTRITILVEVLVLELLLLQLHKEDHQEVQELEGLKTEAGIFLQQKQLNRLPKMLVQMQIEQLAIM